MRQIKFGWVAPVIGVAASQHVPLAIAQQATILPTVAQHFDSVWVYDHLYAFDDHTDPFLECWTTLTWIAARFPTLQVGSLVMAVGFRNPALLAKMGATLHALSGGRLVLGIGAGWRAADYWAYGYPFPKAALRARQLDEAVQIIRRMWTETAPTFEGQHFAIHEAYCFPRPSPAPPILIGGGGEQVVLPLCARMADWWNLWNVDAATYQRKRYLLYRHAEAAGRDPQEMVLTYAEPDCRLPQSPEDSARMLDHLQHYTDLGVTHFMLDFGVVTSTEPIMRFHEEVIIPLNHG